MWLVNPDVLITDLSDELVLMHPGAGEMFSLNASGRLIWQALPGTLEALTGKLAQAYQLSSEQARADASAVLQSLLERDLVSVSGE